MSTPDSQTKGEGNEPAHWSVAEAEGDHALSAFVRARTGAPWSKVKRWIATAKVFVNAEPEAEPGRRLAPGDEVSLHMNAPRTGQKPALRIAYEDTHLVVIDKPAEVSTVPYERGERGTALDLLRDAWRQAKTTRPQHPLGVVHRLDKATSGLVVLAKSKRAERGLARQFRAHTTERCYLCIAHGRVRAQRIESRIISDRGDRLRGSTRHPAGGKRAVTHVKPREFLSGATLCEVKLETGRTHQIRVHLSEEGHPLVGDRVYSRDFARAGHPLIEAPRLLLHAHTLGFEHPLSERWIALKSPLPEEFQALLEALRSSRQRPPS